MKIIKIASEIATGTAKRITIKTKPSVPNFTINSKKSVPTFHIKNKMPVDRFESSTIKIKSIETPNNATTDSIQTSKITIKKDEFKAHIYKFGRNITSSQLEEECNIFKRITGAQLHIPTLAASEGMFSTACTVLERAARDGNFPKDIKHVLIGHGTGSSVNNTWEIINGGGNVFRLINQRIPKGEKDLVLSCEQGTKLAGKRGIGDEVQLNLTDRFQPAKIVQAGKNEIIGDIYFPNLINGSTRPVITYYDKCQLFKINNK